VAETPAITESGFKDKAMMRPGGMGIMAYAGIMALGAPARADDMSDAAAKQLAGLFMQSCIQFSGDKEGLRGWANMTGLAQLPAEAQKRFLYGMPGAVFDASNATGKFVLISEDSGSCSVVAQSASGSGAVTDLEQDMTAAKITFRVASDQPDSQEKALEHREYVASRGEREWRLLVSTVKNAGGGQVMLTANRP
jgi:hypothetical protein